DELVAEALSAAFGTWQRQKDASQSGGQPLSFAKLIDDYLRDAHRNSPGRGCAFSALPPEIARGDKRTRAPRPRLISIRTQVESLNARGVAIHSEGLGGLPVGSDC